MTKANVIKRTNCFHIVENDTMKIDTSGYKKYKAEKNLTQIILANMFK